MKVKFLVPVFIFSIAAFSQSLASSAPSWWENKLAGSYYQNASIVGRGSSAHESLAFLQSYFAANTEWQKKTMEIDGFQLSYFLSESNNGSPTEIVALPFVCKKTQYVHDLTFDTKINDPLSTKLLKDITIQFMESLQDLHAGNLKVHFLAHQGPLEKKYTKLGKSIYKILGDDITAHCQYACAELNTEKMNLTVYDSVFLNCL